MSIDSIVNLVAGKVVELVVQEAKLLYSVKDEVESLTKEFRSMNDFLIKMESMDEEGNDEQSQSTIKEIRKLAYDAEDLIESYILENSSPANKKEDLFKRHLCFCSCLVRTHQISTEIQAITKSINETVERWKKFQKNPNEGTSNAWAHPKRRRRMNRPIAYAHNREDHVVGLDEDINNLIEVLTSDDTKIKVVSILGMGGSGKSTLARKLYNHEGVKAHFDCVAWVSVSQTWDPQAILLNLFKKVGGRTDESLSSLEILVEKVYLFLEEKKYLIVLDDVWEDEALTMIVQALPLGSNGKKIIVTTRNQKVVDYPDLKPLTHTHKPRRLSQKESWDLFRKIAFIHSEESGYSDDIGRFEVIGKQMLKKCGGLPLAVIALAGILQEKQTVEDWEKVKEAVSSRIMADGKGTHLYGPVEQMLLLSYYDLPRELKPCLLYLARYPEDHSIGVEELLQLWIAEGFITLDDKVHEGDTLEDVAQQYLDELIYRCVVEVARTDYAGKVVEIHIHDLVRDLCLKKAKKEQFLAISMSDAIDSRRAAIFYNKSTDPADLEDVDPSSTKNQHLRSLFYYKSRPYQSRPASKLNQQRIHHLRSLLYNGLLPFHGPFSKLNLQVICQSFKLLRVMQLHGIKSLDGTLPREIGRLIHLRYLGLRKTNISRLPSSIGKLRNLLTLHYSDVVYLRDDSPKLRIPDVVWKIKGLRHLYLSINGSELKVDKLQLHTLTNLQTLVVGVLGGTWMLPELPFLSPTVRKLQLGGIDDEKTLEAVFQCPSIKMDHLHSLNLEWYNEPGQGSQEVKLESIESIIHSQHLRKLRLCGRMGDRFATYGAQFPTSINKLDLVITKFGAEDTLVALGKLPRLITLRLHYEAYSGTKWTCSAGEFPQLQELVVWSLNNLEEWSIERGAMPQLKKLSVQECRGLSRIPEGLKFITTLQELTVGGMSDEFIYLSNMSQRLGGDLNEGGFQHVPKVTRW